MQGSPGGSPGAGSGPAGFKTGVARDDERKVDPCAAGCGVFFYLVILVQVIMFIVVLATANAKMPTDGECPSGYTFRHGFYCLEDSLKTEWEACIQNVQGIPGGRRLEDSYMMSANATFAEHMHKLASGDPKSPRERQTRELAARRLQGSVIPQDLWQFLEEFVEMPIVIFGTMFILASLWLIAMTKMTGAVVWGTLVFDILALIAGVIFCLVEFGDFNWMLFALAVLFSIGIVVLREQIKTAIVVMHKAMEGLSHNKRLFPISFGITTLWVGFFALWIASLIGLDMVKEIGPGDYDQSSPWNGECDVVNKWPGELRWLWIIVYYWSTFFFDNAKLIVITAQLGEWFFKGDSADKSIWSKALVWAFNPLKSGGANAICSAIMGGTQMLMNYIHSKVSIVRAVFNPIEWIPLCLAFCLKSIVHTYTKFGLVAQAFSGQPFCAGASNTFELLRNKLGEAIICDYVGKRVLSWCTYLLSLGVAMAALTWSNALQGHEEANKIFEEVILLIVVMLLLAYIVSYPFLSIVFIVILENLLPNDIDPTFRAILNSVFAAMFMGSVTNFLLKAMSHVVVSAMDVIYFCFAVEDDCGQKQEERFADLYEAIKKTIVVGTPAGAGNKGVEMGQPVGAQPQQNQMAVQVPQGSAPGSLIQVQGPDGTLLQVAVPPGVMPGQTFMMQIAPAAPPVATPAAQPEVVGVPQNPATNETNQVAKE